MYKCTLVLVGVLVDRGPTDRDLSETRSWPQPTGDISEGYVPGYETSKVKLEVWGIYYPHSPLGIWRKLTTPPSILGVTCVISAYRRTAHNAWKTNLFLSCVSVSNTRNKAILAVDGSHMVEYGHSSYPARPPGLAAWTMLSVDQGTSELNCVKKPYEEKGWLVLPLGSTSAEKPPHPQLVLGYR